MLPGQLIVAHRGASSDAPENTLAAFQLAWQQGADAIEGDFRLTADQQIVCIHDDSTKRVSNQDLVVAASHSDQLRALDVGSWKHERYRKERIPNLREVLETVPQDKKFFIEIKCGSEIVPFLCRTLNDGPTTPAQTCIISFRSDVIQAVKSQMPDRAAYWLVDFTRSQSTGEWQPTVEEVIKTAQRVKANGVGLNANKVVVNAAFLAACRAVHLGVHVWTVNDVESACHFQELGVDSITTNHPRVMKNHACTANKVGPSADCAPAP